jgi:hypothetical protein
MNKIKLEMPHRGNILIAKKHKTFNLSSIGAL